MILPFALLLVNLVTVSQPKPIAHDSQRILGWQVMMDKRLAMKANEAIAKREIQLLSAQLTQITVRVPSDKVKWMQDHVRIFLDINCGDLHSPQYHPEAAWLKEHGYLTEMVHCVHIPDASYFNDGRFQMHQPLGLLHEMAHAYHDQVLDFENAEIKDAYASFKSDSKHAKVLRSSGKLEPHYALTNQMEFFAEFSESYFGANDFYPFNQGELKESEPKIYELMKKVWGPTP